MSKIRKVFYITAFIVVVLIAAAFAIPPVRERLVFHFGELRTRVWYALKPPEKAVFVPQANPDGEISTAVAMTVAAWTPTPQPTETPTPTLEPLASSPTPRSTATPLPGYTMLEGVRYMDQHSAWNYCAPTNLAMALSYWGWPGTREDVGRVVKPFSEDKNVMAYELADYVRQNTNYGVVLRYGGTLDIVRNLIANGFAVLIEKGTYIHETSTGRLSWMGHYNVITGYNDATREFTVQDSYFKADYIIPYDTILSEWRAFNYVFIVIYPQEKELMVLAALGDYSDENTALQIAAQTASNEIFQLQGIDQYFAWFNRGTSLLNLQDYAGAAAAYDQAFSLYPNLPEDKRPWRMMWYQTGPYFAYYYTNRYRDVIALANTTIEVVEKPYIEESFYWRGMARIQVNDIEGAVNDFRTAIKYHPGFSPAINGLKSLGMEP